MKNKEVNKPFNWLLIGMVAVILLAAIPLALKLLNKDYSSQVVGLGLNSESQQGGQNTSKKNTTLTPLELTKDTTNQKFSDVRAGNYHTLLLTKSGTVYAMGDNKLAQVSQENSTRFAFPTKVNFTGLEQSERIVQIDSSRDHSIAVTNHGRVYTWGSNYSGQLGDDTNATRAQAKLVRGLPKITQVAAGYRHSAAIAEDGSVYGWGGSCSDETTSAAEAALAQAGSGIVSLGGYGSTNQADLQSENIADCSTQATTFVQSKTPQQLKGLQGKATSLSIGYGTLLVLTDQGQVFSAGCNTYKQLGRVKPTGADKNDLGLVQLPQKAVMVSSGFRHSAVILEDHSVWLWGYNGPQATVLAGNSVESMAQPTQVKDLLLDTVEAAHDTTFGIKPDGELVGWGQDDVKAFWQDGSVIHSLAQLGTSNVKLSAGREHLLVLKPN